MQPKTITRQPHSGCHPLSKEGHWRESKVSAIPGNMPLAYSPILQNRTTKQISSDKPLLKGAVSEAD
jgi:hypothetical protein